MLNLLDCFLGLFSKAKIWKNDGMAGLVCISFVQICIVVTFGEDMDTYGGIKS